MFQQPRFFEEEDIDRCKEYFTSRGGLNVCGWAIDNDFGLPIGVNGFITEWDECVDDIHEQLKYMPPPEYQSPRQREKELLRQRLVQEEQRRQMAQLEAERLSMEISEVSTLESRAVYRRQAEEAEKRAEEIKAAAKHDPILSLMLRFDVETREIFEGTWMHKKFHDEKMYRKRFCWIDVETRRFYWSKVESQSDPKKKYMSLVDEVAEDGITLYGNRWSIAHSSQSKGRGLDLELLQKDNAVTRAADWAEVAGALHKS